MSNRRLAGLLALLLWMAAAARGLAAADPAPALQRALAAADRITPGLVWGGRSPADIPVLVQCQGHSWLWGHPAAPREFATVGKSRLRRHGSWFPATGTVTHLGGQALPVIHLAPEELADPGLAERIQRARFRVILEDCPSLPGVDDRQLFAWPREDERLYRLQMEADLCFKRAAAAADRHNREQWAWLALESERSRRALLPRNLADWEQGVLIRSALSAWAAAPGGKPRPPVLPEWGHEPDAVRERLESLGAVLVYLQDQLQPGCPPPCSTAPPLDPRDELFACLPGRQPPVRSLSPMDQANLGNAVSERLRSMQVRHRLEQMAYSTQAGWTLVIQASPDDPLWLVEQDLAQIRDLGKAGLLYRNQLSARNQSTHIDVIDHDVLVRSFSRQGGRDLARMELAGLVRQPVVTQQDDRLWISADGLQAEFIQAGFLEEGKVLLVNLPPSLQP
jgi:hypothetical protein